MKPSSPAGAHLDAGIIHFVPGTRVDITKSARYVDVLSGTSLCAAPVVDEETIELSWWAVGVNCCDKEKFWCGDVLSEKVISATRWLDGGPTIHHVPVDFHPAVAKAAAVHGLALGSPQMFVEWTEFPESVRAAKLNIGLTLYLIFQALVITFFAIAYLVKPPPHGIHAPDARSTVRNRDAFGRRTSLEPILSGIQTIA